MPFNKRSLFIDVEIDAGRRRLKEIVFYHDLESSIRVMAEAGFVTDFASVPQLLKFAINNEDNPEIIRPSIIHDWIYRHGGKMNGFTFNSKVYPRAKLSRAQADKIFYNALRAEHLGRFKATLMYLAVRVCGRFSWN